MRIICACDRSGTARKRRAIEHEAVKIWVSETGSAPEEAALLRLRAGASLDAGPIDQSRGDI